MRVLVTGAGGFVGRNVIDRLSKNESLDIMPYRHVFGEEKLRDLCGKADFIFHFASVCRPKDPSEFQKVNVDMLHRMVHYLEECGNHCPIMFSSSIHASENGLMGVMEYRRTKIEAEQILLDYSKRTGARVLIYRLPNLFGKWGTPEYNNVMHTFCHHINHELPIRIDNPETTLKIQYIEDLLDDLECCLVDNSYQDYCEVKPIYEVTLHKIVGLLKQYRDGYIPVFSDSLEYKLYKTYISYR